MSTAELKSDFKGKTTHRRWKDIEICNTLAKGGGYLSSKIFLFETWDDLIKPCYRLICVLHMHMLEAKPQDLSM